jgi:hypothetical protein
MKKEARGFPENPKFVAEQIRDIIDVMVGRMSLESRQRAYPNLRNKINRLPVTEMSSKKQPGGSSIGVSISLIKNILNGRDPFFIKSVINELLKVL